jgi:hypothetical protein
MAKLYLRKAIVNIGSLSGFSGKTIDQLRVQFEVEKTNESNPNTANIKIFNLSEATRSSLEAPDTKVSLEVGYEEISKVVFNGDVTKAVHDREGDVDIVTTLECGDGDNSFRNSRVSRGFPPGVSTTQIVEELIKSTGLARGPVLGVPPTTYPYGFSMFGMSRKYLDDICEKNDLEWSIQNEKIQILPKFLGRPGGPIVVSVDTGLVGKPNKTDKGVEFKMLINPEVEPGRYVELQSNFVSGTFKVRRVKMNGDNQGGDFLSEVEATL